MSFLWKNKHHLVKLTSKCLFSQEMAPRKLALKRSRKDKAAEGTNSAPEYDSHRFRSAEN